MENTLENKARFCAQYWGQKVLTLDMNNNYPNQKPWFDFIYDEHYKRPAFLHLKNIKDITTADFIEAAILCGFESGDYKLSVPDDNCFVLQDGDDEDFTLYFENCLMYYNNHNSDFATRSINIYNAYEFLKRQGYYIGEGEEIEFGWVKLIEK